MFPDHDVRVPLYLPFVCLFIYLFVLLVPLFPLPDFLKPLVELQEAPHSASCPLPGESPPVPQRASRFAQCKYVGCGPLGWACQSPSLLLGLFLGSQGDLITKTKGIEDSQIPGYAEWDSRELPERGLMGK